MAIYDLLIGAEAFWARAADDIAHARQRVLVQAMTCEGDAAGQALAAALVGATARDRRLLVDAYSLHVTNDTLLPLLPWQPEELRREARATRGLLDGIAAVGVGVRVTNPVRGQPLRFPLRNHKKSLVIDDVAYLGGINFSDHNFAWHDAMVRIADARVAAWLAGDFARDWRGRPLAARQCFGDDLALVSLSGEGNEAAFAPVFDLLAGARRSIELIGAYPTLPFTGALADAARRGCAVTLYTPAESNKPLLRHALFALAAENAVRLRLLPEMTHAKAVLIDGETVLFGSVNFNFASYRSNGDLLAIGREPALVSAFDEALFAPARCRSVAVGPGLVPFWRASVAGWTLRLADAALARLRHGPIRVAEWAPARVRPSPAAEPQPACS